MYEVEKIWNGIKARANKGGNSSYENCKICDEWNNDFDSFAEWFFDNIYFCGDEKLEIDKDLFSNGEKIYSPETCCFLPKRINVMLAYKRKRESDLPTGVNLTANKKYIVTIHRGRGHLTKTFNSVEEAAEYYNSNKERYIRELAEFYKKYLPDRIYNKLITFKCN